MNFNTDQVKQRTSIWLALFFPVQILRAKFFRMHIKQIFALLLCGVKGVLNNVEVPLLFSFSWGRKFDGSVRRMTAYINLGKTPSCHCRLLQFTVMYGRNIPLRSYLCKYFLLCVNKICHFPLLSLLSDLHSKNIKIFSFNFILVYTLITRTICVYYLLSCDLHKCCTFRLNCQIPFHRGIQLQIA